MLLLLSGMSSVLGAVSSVHLSTEGDDLTEQEVNFLTCEVAVFSNLPVLWVFPAYLVSPVLPVEERIT